VLLAGVSSQQESSHPTIFNLQLKAILSDPANKEAVAWLPHGKSFLVMNRKKFVQLVLPKYLGKATKYTSFTRKLSRWNFSRVASGADEGAWFNKVRVYKCCAMATLNAYAVSNLLVLRPLLTELLPGRRR
jgi:hypothetical protein